MNELLASAGTSFPCLTYDGAGLSDVPVTLGQDDVVAILLDEDGYVFEYFNEGTYWETVQNFATGAPTLVILAGSEDCEVVRVARRERALFADCFGVPLEVVS